MKAVYSRALHVIRVLDIFARVLGARYFAIIYLATIALAEFITAYLHPILGLIGHSGILATLVVHAAMSERTRERVFVTSLTLAPLIRIVALTVRSDVLPVEWSFLSTALPVLVACVLTIRSSEFKLVEIGVRLPIRSTWAPTVVLSCLGVIVGSGAYMHSVLSLSESFEPLGGNVLVALIGFAAIMAVTEELIFRGVLLLSAINLLRVPFGIVFASAAFAIMHVGHRYVLEPWPVVLLLAAMFLFGLLLATVTLVTRSLLMATIIHIMAILLGLLVASIL